MSRDYPEIVEARGKELDALRGKYQKAKADATALGSDKHQQDLLLLHKLMATYRAGDTGERAIYLVAQATFILDSIIAPIRIVNEYEEKERSLEKLKVAG